MKGSTKFWLALFISIFIYLITSLIIPNLSIITNHLIENRKTIMGVYFVINLVCFVMSFSLEYNNNDNFYSIEHKIKGWKILLIIIFPLIIGLDLLLFTINPFLNKILK